MINSINDNKYFQYPAKVTLLNHEEIETHMQRISKIKIFINKCSCKRINYQSGIGDWIKFEKNNPTIALNTLYVRKWIYIVSTFQKTT